MLKIAGESALPWLALLYEGLLQISTTTASITMGVIYLGVHGQQDRVTAMQESLTNLNTIKNCLLITIKIWCPGTTGKGLYLIWTTGLAKAKNISDLTETNDRAASVKKSFFIGHCLWTRTAENVSTSYLTNWLSVIQGFSKNFTYDPIHIKSYTKNSVSDSIHII